MQDSNSDNFFGKLSDKTVLILGDVILDQYTYGKVERISPEAPVPILKKMHDMFVPGGAANTAFNVRALGAKAILVGVTGEDERRKKLLEILKAKNMATGGLVADAGRPTILKQRFAVNASQLLRVDEEETKPLDAAKEKEILAKVEEFLPQANIVVFSDYNKGFFSKNLTEKILAKSSELGKQVIADFKSPHKDIFIGVDYMVPNLKEGREMSGADEAEDIGAKLVADFGCHVFLKRGQDGISVFHKDGIVYHVPTRKIKVFDVSGAGDTVTAVLALALANGLDLKSAAQLANAGGNVVVQKPGTATVSEEELKSFMKTVHLEEVSVVPKIWGYEKWLENNEGYCSKLLHLNKGYQCSLHYHKIKDETFLVTSGHVRLELGDEVLHMREGNFVRVPPGTRHRFRGMEDSTIIEVSTHHDEADSYRIEESRKMEAHEFHDA